ncbi:MAG: ABC transporter permease subunit [Bacteroidetes bacterium]|nr:ABC transporter permease subunit [Bacteroidota bacterium]
MIKTIFLKELKDTLRDKRTLVMMIVIPVLVFPIIMNVFVKISSSFEKEAAEKTLKIGFVGDAQTMAIQGFLNMPKTMGKLDLVPYASKSDLMKDVKLDSIQIGAFVPNNAIALENELKAAPLEIYYDATDVGITSRAKIYVDHIVNESTKKRYSQLKLNESEIVPLAVSYNNVASDMEMIGKLAGGLLPYIFIAFGFIGCMYPAIDLFTGEKERGTIETLLTTPVARWKILFGKMGVVVTSGLVAASCAILGLYLSIEIMDLDIDENIMNIVRGVLSFSFIISLFVLLLPLTIFFAGVMIPIAIYAKSFKEAQSIITPLNILMVLPAMVGFFPGIELNVVTACIPVVNVVLATKEMIAGTLDLGLMCLSFGVMLAIAGLAVVISYRHFGKETNVAV